MTKPVSLKVDGIKQTTQAFTLIEKGAKHVVKAAVREHLEMVGTESQRQVPRITGKLARSMRIEVRERPAIFGTIDYTAPYAVQVHEVQRPPSSTGKWKYLEDPFKQQEGLLRPRLGDAVTALVEGVAKTTGRGRSRADGSSAVLRRLVSLVKREMRGSDDGDDE